jgi:hypothetical protein
MHCRHSLVLLGLIKDTSAGQRAFPDACLLTKYDAQLDATVPAGDIVKFSVQLINSGNVHLQSVDLSTITNSSTTYMNTSFPMDCGAKGTLPMRVTVKDSFTCTRDIIFTTPVSLSLWSSTHQI